MSHKNTHSCEFAVTTQHTLWNPLQHTTECSKGLHNVRCSVTSDTQTATHIPVYLESRCNTPCGVPCNTQSHCNTHYSRICLKVTMQHTFLCIWSYDATHIAESRATHITRESVTLQHTKWNFLQHTVLSVSRDSTMCVAV